MRLSSLGLNSTVDDREILVHVPRSVSFALLPALWKLCVGRSNTGLNVHCYHRLTNDTLTAMQKLVKKEGESAKLRIRSVRRDILDAIKKVASSDDRKRLEKQVKCLSMP